MNETDTDRDSRQGQPSSSSRQLTKECPASHKENLKVKGLVETPEQKTGTLYHAGFEGDPFALHQLAGNADFKKLNNYFKFQERKIIRQIFRTSRRLRFPTGLVFKNNGDFFSVHDARDFQVSAARKDSFTVRVVVKSFQESESQKASADNRPKRNRKFPDPYALAFAPEGLVSEQKKDQKNDRKDCSHKKSCL
jgi:hypothetical protein